MDASLWRMGRTRNGGGGMTTGPMQPDERASVIEIKITPDSYPQVECLDCDHLDTHGGAEYLDLGREHVHETGHTVRIVRRSYINLERRP